VSGVYATLGESDGYAPDFLTGPADQILMVGIRGLFLGVASLARYRITAIMAKAKHDEGDMAMPAMP